jgi:pyruvate,water dikinase
MAAKDPYVRWFSDLRVSDVASVGGKNSSLGELYQHLMPAGIRVPDGFAVTAQAYQSTLRESDWAKLHSLLDNITKDSKTVANVHEVAKQCRDVVYNAALSPELEKQILEAYRKLSKDGIPASVAVRSSATAEDLPSACECFSLSIPACVEKMLTLSPAHSFTCFSCLAIRLPRSLYCTRFS